MNLGGLNEIKTRLVSRWDRGFFLKSFAAGEDLFPFEVPLKGPPASKIAANFEDIRTWIAEIQTGCKKEGLRLEWKEINNRQLGRNSIPQKIIFIDIEQLSSYLGKKADFNKFTRGRAELLSALPELEDWSIHNPFKLTENTENIGRLIKILKWIRKHPRPGIFLRQLSIPGVDTKFIEKHKKLLGSWLDIVLEPSQIDKEYSGAGRFEQRYGFKNKPVMIRFRMLDPATLEGLGGPGFSDLSVPASEFSLFNPPVRRIFVVENDITSLAFPIVSDSLLIFGRGYNFGDLKTINWMQEKEIWYWGDIDTHGFAILSQFRGSFPNTRSFLMDRETLHSHRDHWGVEAKQCLAKLSGLTAEEAELYDDLQTGSIRPKLRLEQEFVSYSKIQDALQLHVLQT
jgi:hypothetical protein